jgi:hypothetical protein
MNHVGGVAMCLAWERLHQHDCRLLYQKVQGFAMPVSATAFQSTVTFEENMRLTLGTQVLCLGVA